MLGFQLTHPRAGCDEKYGRKSVVNRLFNSHTPSGVRPLVKKYNGVGAAHFNSRTPYSKTGYKIFQFSHPTRSATAILALHPLRPEISTPAPMRGANFTSAL